MKRKWKEVQVVECFGGKWMDAALRWMQPEGANWKELQTEPEIMEREGGPGDWHQGQWPPKRVKITVEVEE